MTLTVKSILVKWADHIAHEDSVEEVRYYGGFSNIVPNDLCLLSQSGKTAEMKIYSSGEEVQIGSDEWRTDTSLNSWDDNVPKVIKLTQNDRLYVQGSSMSSAGGEKIFYAIMKDEAGELFYARAEQMRLKIPCGFLNSSERDVDGFCLKIPMWDLSIGKYEFFFVEIDADGEMYCSPIMGNVEIGE